MLPHSNIIKDFGRILFWFPVRWCVELMPFSIVYLVGSILGNLNFYFSGKKHIKKMSVNIREAIDCTPKAAKKIVRENLQHHIRNVLELIKYPQLNPQNISRIIRFEGIEYLENELAKGKGVILLTGHYGTKQALQVGLGHNGYRVNQIYYHMESGELSWIQKHVSQRQRIKIEEQIPTKFISSNGFLRSAVTCLRDNQILILAGDGIGIKEHMDKTYQPFTFLGKPMLFPAGSISMARRTGAGILVAFAIREKWKQKIVIEPPLDLEQKSDHDCFKQFVHILEKNVQKCPSRWEFWEEFEKGYLIEDK